MLNMLTSYKKNLVQNSQLRVNGEDTEYIYKPFILILGILKTIRNVHLNLGKICCIVIKIMPILNKNDEGKIKEEYK